jgi:hypothetical protein
LLHEAGPPLVEAILKTLDEMEVAFVITGSVAAQLYGVDLQPADLDIVPATDTGNLDRLLRVLDVLEARPPGPFGEWMALANGEVKWTARPTAEEEIQAWTPRVDDVSSLDHCYRSRFGNFDIVPSVTGTYEVLKKRAVQIPAFGCHPWVAHIDELLARLTVPRRDKDVARVGRLRDVQRALGEQQGARLAAQQRNAAGGTSRRR